MHVIIFYQELDYTDNKERCAFLRSVSSTFVFKSRLVSSQKIQNNDRNYRYIPTEESTMAAAAPDDGPVAEMESLLTCSICLETLKEPRTLGCFHCFCKCCLQKDVKRQREMEEGKVIETFNCPICKTQFSLKQGEKVEGMLPNHFIGNMLEVLKIQRRAKELPCFFCGSQRPAVSRCTRCEQYLCSKCITTHNNWPGFNEHIVLTIHELAKPENQAKARGKPRCLKHEKKTLKFYCETCKELVCTHCIVLDHTKPNHSCLPIDEVAEKRRELLRASSVILDEQHKEGNEVLQKIEANTESLKNNAKKAKDDITQQKKAILKAFTKKLEEKAALMINEVDRKYNEVYEPLTQQKTDVKAYMDKVKGSMDVAKNLLEKGSHEDVIYIQKLVGENVAKVKNERPGIMKPIHDGNIQFKAKPIVPMDDGKSGNILNDLGEVVCNPVIKPVSCKQSVILNYKYDKQLEKWLGNQFQWRLCYRAGRDGWRAQDFHRCCDKKGGTVTLVKVGDCICGGYTDQSWEGRGPKQSNSSFLFSLKNKDNIPAFKCDIHNKQCAIFSHPNCGPIFGGSDFYISNNSNHNQGSYSNLGNTYQPPPGYQHNTAQTNSLLAGSYNFTPTEIEVFY